MAIAIPGLILVLVALLVLGGLAAVVYALVYAIANKRPGIALAAVLLPLALICGVGLFMGLIGTARPHVRVSTPPPVAITYETDARPALETWDELHRHGGTADLAAWAKIGLLVALLLVVLALFGVFSKSREPHDKCGRRGGWGKAIAVVVVLVLAANYLVLRASYRSSSVAQGRAEAAQEMAEQARLRIEAAQRSVEEAKRRAEELKHKASQFDGKSMQELWEQLNQPRIQLDANDHGATMTVGEGPNKVELRAEHPSGAKLSVPVPEKTAESLSKSITRLERMVRQVSAVAEQMSDVGTLLGRAMVALTDSLDSPPQPAPPAPIAAAQPREPAVPAVPAALVEAGDEVTATYSSHSEIAPTDAEAGEAPAVSRPNWIDVQPKRTRDTWRQVVVAGEYATIDECNRVADIYLLLVTYSHLQQLIGNSLNDESLPMLTLKGEDVYAGGQPIVLAGQPADYRLRLLADMGIGIDYIRREIATDEYVETAERSFGEMKNLYTLVEFSPSVDGELRRRWDEYRRQERFAVVGVGAGSVLGLLSLVYGLLKVDTWTKGYYTKRLFLVVPAAIIGLLALLGFAVS